MENLKNKAAGIAVAVTLSVGGAFAIDESQRAISIACDTTEQKVENLEEKLRTYRVDSGFLQTREMNSKDRADIKGCEVSKLERIEKERVEFSGARYDIEVVSMEAIDGGVEVFARAWKPDGTQVGFGDGTVDIERFVIMNPPVLVFDPHGTILRESINQATKKREVRTFREDPKSAILDSLAHTISVSKRTHDDSKIELGKRGNTTYTFYPDANPESTSVDGIMQYSSSATFATARAAASADYVGPSDANEQPYFFFRYLNSTPTVSRFIRTAVLFDTSSIPDTETVGSATLSLYGGSTITGIPNQEAVIVSVNLASNTNIVTSDYAIAKWGTTEYATRKAASAWSTGSYNDFSLNASGIAAVSLTSVTKFGLRTGWDLDNSAPAYPSGSGEKNAYMGVYTADTAGTSNDPKLVVDTVSPSSGPVPGANDVIWFQ